MTGIPEGCPVYDPLLVEQALNDGCLIDEFSIQKLLDVVYSNGIGLWWENTVRKAYHDFQHRILSGLYPFETDDRVEKAFTELFEGEEVLPKSLEPDYEALMKTDPLLAPELLVPVILGQFNHLFRQKRLRKQKNNLWVADVAYNAKLGLQLNPNLLNQST